MRITSDDGEKMGRFAKFVITILVLAGIILTTIFFAVRTQGGREFVNEWLEKRLGMELSVEKTSIGWPYVLVIENLESASASREKEPALSVREIRIGLGVKARWNIRINKCVLNLTQNRDGNWDPAFFCRLGTLPEKNIAEISYLTEDFRREIALHVRSSSIRWLKRGDNDVSALARGISFDMGPVRLPGRKMHHYSLSIDNVLGVGADRVYDVEREWLADDIRGYIEIGTSGREAYGSRSRFWEIEEDSRLRQPVLRSSPATEGGGFGGQGGQRTPARPREQREGAGGEDRGKKRFF